jgi:hypothetical protein
MPVRIVSIPHMGTRAAIDALGCKHSHVFVRELDDWKGFTEPLLICPLRDPLNTWRSWVKRVNVGHGAVDLDLFQKQFHHLEALDKEYDFFYLPVDRPNFDLLDELSDRLGILVRLGKIGNMNASFKTDHPEPNWEYIYNLPFIKRFYETPVSLEL